MLGWELPPHKSYGLGVACYHIAKALASHGAQINFVVPYTADHPGIDFMTIHGATKLKPLDQYGFSPYDGVEKTFKTGGEIGSGGYCDIREVQQNYIRFVEYLVTDVKPDVIHVHDWLTMEAGARAKQLTGAPLVVHVHATEYDRSGGNYGNPLVHAIEYQGLMMADKIIAVSNYTKQIIMQEYGILSDKIEVVYHALDTAKLDDSNYHYSGSTYKYLSTLKKEGFTVVSYVGRLTLQKGLTFFLKSAAKAVQKYDKFAFLIAGDGEQRDELIRLATDLGIVDKIFFTGFINGQAWRDAFNVSDIFVMSSISEPFGLTALEAAYHNNAIIVTKQSGVGEILDSVFRYDFWDEDALADELVGLATSPTLLNTMKQDVKKEYSNISWDEVAATLMRIYDKLPKGALHE